MHLFTLSYLYNYVDNKEVVMFFTSEMQYKIRFNFADDIYPRREKNRFCHSLVAYHQTDGRENIRTLTKKCINQ